ncbi:hypothetical protein WG899_10610 [Paucibacter sp. AS339]
MPSTSIVTQRRPRHSQRAITTAKALSLVAVIWGLLYPALLWGMGALLRV